MLFSGWHFQGPNRKRCSLVSCVAYYTGAPSNFCPPTSHREPGKRTVPLYCLPTPLVPLPPTPAQGTGTRLPSRPRAPAWPGSVLLATCRGMTWRGAGERVGTTILSPGRAWAPTPGRAGSSPSAPPFLGHCQGCLWGQESRGQPPVRGGARPESGGNAGGWNMSTEEEGNGTNSGALCPD